MSKQATIGEQEVTMDRRREERRNASEISADCGSVSEDSPARRKKQRRRQIDPTTCERDYNSEEIDFMQALDAYKRSSGRMFPTCSEILEVLRGLGYVRLTPEQMVEFFPAAETAEDSADETIDELESELGSELDEAVL